MDREQKQTRFCINLLHNSTIFDSPRSREGSGLDPGIQKYRTTAGEIIVSISKIKCFGSVLMIINIKQHNNDFLVVIRRKNVLTNYGIFSILSLIWSRIRIAPCFPLPCTKLMWSLWFIVNILIGLANIDRCAGNQKDTVNQSDLEQIDQWCVVFTD